jgi:hypothetical protein
MYAIIINNDPELSRIKDQLDVSSDILMVQSIRVI